MMSRSREKDYTTILPFYPSPSCSDFVLGSVSAHHCNVKAVCLFCLFAFESPAPLTRPSHSLPYPRPGSPPPPSLTLLLDLIEVDDDQICLVLANKLSEKLLSVVGTRAQDGQKVSVFKRLREQVIPSPSRPQCRALCLLSNATPVDL